MKDQQRFTCLKNKIKVVNLITVINIEMIKSIYYMVLSHKEWELPSSRI